MRRSTRMAGLIAASVLTAAVPAGEASAQWFGSSKPKPAAASMLSHNGQQFTVVKPGQSESAALSRRAASVAGPTHSLVAHEEFLAQAAPVGEPIGPGSAEYGPSLDSPIVGDGAVSGLPMTADLNGYVPSDFDPSMGGLTGYGGYCANGNCGSAAGGIPCPTCQPYKYVSFEALYMTRDDNDDDRSGFARDRFVFNDYDLEPGFRATYGSIPDCTTGFEISGMYLGDLERNSSRLRNALSSRLLTSAQLNTVLTTGTTPPVFVPPAVPIADVDFQSFQTVANQESEIYSLEASRVLYAWDVARILIGGRYIKYNDEFNFARTAVGPATGVTPVVLNPATPVVAADDVQLLRSEADNDLFGLQVGGDIFNPVSRFGSTYIRGRAGVYLNAADADLNFSLFGDGAAGLNNRLPLTDDDVDIAGFFEFGTGLRYQVGEALSLQAGGEFWYLTGVATSTAPLGRRIDDNFRNEVDISDDVFFYGITAGATYRF